jgi:hypothetical protein
MIRIRVKIKDYSYIIGKFFKFSLEKDILMSWTYTRIYREDQYIVAEWKFITNSQGEKIDICALNTSHLDEELYRIHNKQYQEVTDELELQNLHEIERNQRIQDM